MPKRYPYNDTCNNCKNEYLRFKPLQSLCVSCIIEKQRAKSKEKQIKNWSESRSKSVVKKSKPKSFNLYATTAWKHFSRTILLRHCDKDGNVKCVTSVVEYKVNDKNICAGHFIKVKDANSSNYSVAFNEKNVYPQSVQENRYKGGNQETMKQHIINVHGIETLEELTRISKQPLKLDKNYLDEKRKEWKDKFDLEVKRLGFNPWK